MSAQTHITVSKDDTVTKTVIDEEKKVICDVCGYANPANTTICKKCSNYLEGDKRQ